MTNIEIGRRIKAARSKNGLTLQDVAAKVGVAKSTIQRYEAGAIEKIKLPVIVSIARALNVNAAWIIGKSSDIYLDKAAEQQSATELSEDAIEIAAAYDHAEFQVKQGIRRFLGLPEIDGKKAN